MASTEVCFNWQVCWYCWM